MTYLNKLAKPYSKDPNGLSATRKRSAYEELCNRLANVTSYKDYFAGVGIGASVVADQLSPNIIRLQEIDPSCLETLRSKFPKADTVSADFFSDDDSNRYDLIALDFNVFTLLQFGRITKLRDATEKATRLLTAGGHVILTDSARNKFHLNLESYGVTDFRGYTSKVATALGMRLVAYEDKVEVAYLLLRAQK